MIMRSSTADVERDDLQQYAAAREGETAGRHEHDDGNNHGDVKQREHEVGVQGGHGQHHYPRHGMLRSARASVPSALNAMPAAVSTASAQPRRVSPRKATRASTTYVDHSDDADLGISVLGTAHTPLSLPSVGTVSQTFGTSAGATRTTCTPTAASSPVDSDEDVNPPASGSESPSPSPERPPPAKKRRGRRASGASAKPRQSTAGAPRVHDCVHCSKPFARKSDLHRHIRTHMDDKPYECSTCQKRFVQFSALKCHQRIHTGEKPYECSTCGLRLTDSSSLARHKRVHSGEKPYTCNVAECGRSFCRNTTLAKHQCREHGMDSFRPDGTPYCNPVLLAEAKWKARKLREGKRSNRINAGAASTSPPSIASTNFTAFLDNGDNGANDSGAPGTAVVSSHTRANENRQSHQADTHAEAMDGLFARSGNGGRRASVISFASSLQPAESTQSIAAGTSPTMVHQAPLPGNLEDMPIGLTTVQVAVQQLGSQYMSRQHYNIPHLTLPPNAINLIGHVNNEHGLSSNTTQQPGMSIPFLLDHSKEQRESVHHTAFVGTMPDVPSTPGTPASAGAGCFSFREGGLAPRMVSTTPLACRQNEGVYLSVHSGYSSRDEQVPRTRVPTRAQSKMEETATLALSVADEEDEKFTRGYPLLADPTSRDHRRYQGNVNLRGRMYPHIANGGLSRPEDSAPYRAAYLHTFGHLQIQNEHTSAFSSASPTQTMLRDCQDPYLERYQSDRQDPYLGRCQSYDPQDPVHRYYRQQYQHSSRDEQGKRYQDDHEHLATATPASASSSFSTSSGNGIDKHSISPSSAFSSSPYTHQFSLYREHSSHRVGDEQFAQPHYQQYQRHHGGPSTGNIEYDESEPPYAHHVPHPLCTSAAHPACRGEGTCDPCQLSLSHHRSHSDSPGQEWIASSSPSHHAGARDAVERPDSPFPPYQLQQPYPYQYRPQYAHNYYYANEHQDHHRKYSYNNDNATMEYEGNPNRPLPLPRSDSFLIADDLRDGFGDE